MFPIMFWILVVTAAVLCGVGFYRFVWFMTVGYGLAVAGCGAALLADCIVNQNGSIPYLLLCALLIVYGCRLGLFLLIRELKNALYKKTLDAQTRPVPMPVKVVMWIMMSLLYPMQVSAVMYRSTNGILPESGDVCLWIGAVIMLAGILIESVADKQKSAAKKVNPNMVAMNGLFKLCRCPNYFGEILFWTGCVVSGLNAVKGGQWIIVILGYVAIVYIMFAGAKRLEIRQNKNYGDKQEYIDYSNSTPILIPFIPFYHIVKEEQK